MQYDVDYFIRKFEAIPEDQIGYSQDDGCAFGQCRNRYNDDGSATPEGKALYKLMSTLIGLTPSPAACYPPYCGTPARINNGDVAQYQQPTPKQRILAALYDIKKIQQSKDIDTGNLKEVKERIVYVTVDQPVRELQKQELIEN